MSFDDTLNQTIEMLRRNKRVSYRALRRQFGVDEAYIGDLKAEIIEVLKVGADVGGEILEWTGAEEAAAAPAAAPPEQKKPEAAAARPSEGERRHLTVMFCDLVDSTPLAERLDPEELAEVYNIWQEACAEAIKAQGGHISDYRGDGVFVYFGYPHALEDAPHRAIRAALNMLERLTGVNEQLRRLHAVTLQVRIGIHTGLVLLSDLGGRFVRDQFALGETPNVAARLQALAQPDQIVISGAMRNLVRGYFNFEDLGEHSLKGISRAVTAVRVLGATGALDRFQAGDEKGRTSFIARESEIAALRLRWGLSLGGRGQAVVLTGEAGIGKSRIVQAAVAMAEADGAQRVVFRCSSYHSASDLHPVIEHSRRFLAIGRDEPAQASYGKLLASLEQSDSPDPARDAELISAVLGFAPAALPLTQALSAPQRRTEMLAAMVGWGVRSALRHPLMFIAEDLQWADPTTLEFFSLVLDAMAKARICLVMTARPDCHLPFPQTQNFTRIAVGRLTDREAKLLVISNLRGRSIPGALRRQIVARADGVPLFIEELVAMIFESGMLREQNGMYVPVQPLAVLPIPTTLQDSLAARLDRLAPAREAAQLASALGREFSFELISAVSPWETSDLLGKLEMLVDSELIQQQGLAPSAVYRFKHALIQDAAYQSMLKTRRLQYHRLIATALAEKFPAMAETQPEIVAHHFTEAGLIDEAARHWLSAGEKALGRSANLEALLHLGRGLALVEKGEATPARVRDELHLRMARGAALLMVKGQSAPEVEACFTRARELSQGMDDTPDLFMVLFGLWRTHIVRGSLPQARDTAEQLMGIAGRLGDKALLVSARAALSLVLYHFCDLKRALELAQASIDVYAAMAAQERLSPTLRIGQHPVLGSYLCKAFILLVTGAPEQSLACQRQAAQFAEATGMPFQIVSAAGWSLFLGILRRDADTTLESAEAVLALAREHGFPFWEFHASYCRGILLVGKGRFEEGLALARAGVADIDRLNAGLSRVRLHAMTAQALGKAGEPGQGLILLRQAHSFIAGSGEQWWAPELRRIEGELVLQSKGGDAGEAEQSFRKALEIAGAGGLHLFELRAATSLARLLHARKRTDEARATLAPALGKFTEGFGLRDLVEARVLLDQLAA